jgi:hypothetical protein
LFWKEFAWGFEQVGKNNPLLELRQSTHFGMDRRLLPRESLRVVTNKTKEVIKK